LLRASEGTYRVLVRGSWHVARALRMVSEALHRPIV
jgi:hypothetical protein